LATATNGACVVIPTHNRPDLIATTLNAVLAQRDVDFEVIVIDDGSDPPIVLPPHHRLRVIRHPAPRGVSAARNLGIAVATKQWLAFTDDDDIWAPDKLHSQLRALAETPGARWCAGGAVQVDDDLAIFDSNRPPTSGDVAAELLASNPIPGGASGVVAEADLVRSVGGFDERLSMCADYDLWIRLGLTAPMAAVQRPLLAYRVHDGGMSRSLENIRDELRMIEQSYADERTARGVVVNDEIELWIGDRNQRSGRRITAARAYLRAASTVGRPRAIGRALEAIFWRGAFRQRDERRRRGVPSAWVYEVDQWLEPIREQDRQAARWHSAPS